MSRHLQRQVETLKKKMLQVGSLVEEAIAKALKRSSRAISSWPRK